jgi:radical SAM protein with 4Fe4S-binding SPASM domain
MDPMMEKETHPHKGDNLRLSQFVGIAELSSGRSVVWSGLTGFVGIVPSNLALQLKTGEFDKSDEAFEALDAEGLFYEDSENDALIDILESLAKAGSKPTHYRLVLTGSCDLTCSYCIQAKIRKTMDTRLNAKVIDDLVRYVEYHSPPGPVEILLMGGEPLYDVEVAVAAIRDLRGAFAKSERNTPYFKFLTNGLNLFDFVDRIGSDASVIRDIQISIDQDREIHDSAKKDRSGNPTFDRVISGVKHAVRAGIQATLRMNIHDPEKGEQFLLTCDQLYDEIGPDKFSVYPALVIQRPLAKNRRNWSVEAASSSFSRLLVKFFLWHHSKTGQIHPNHIPQARWINCYPKLGPSSMLGSRGEVYSCTYSMPTSPDIDAEMRKPNTFPLSREKCEALAQEVWNETCRGCHFLAFCTGSCSVKTAAGQKFTADCESWSERFRTYGEIIERTNEPRVSKSVVGLSEAT